MEDTPEKFRKGKEAYEELIKKLFEIYCLLPLKARKELFKDKNKKIVNEKSNYGFVTMCEEFNFLLQYALLDAGSSTDNVSYLEMLYIADIGDFATRLDHYFLENVKKKDSRFKYTYLMLPDALPEEVLYIKTCIYEYVEPSKMHMMKAFYIANKLAKRNITNEMLPIFADLYDGFLRVDNRMEKEDPLIAVSKMREVFFNHINDYRSKVKSLLK